MAKDWLPRTDEELNDFVTNFNTQITILGPALSLPFGVLTDFTAALPVWNTKYPAHLAARTAAQAATLEKDDARTDLREALRVLVMFLQTWPATTDTMRIQLGIPVRDTTPSSTQGVPVTIQATATIESTTLHHKLRFYKVGGKPGDAKPAGMKACEIRSTVLPADQPTPTDFGLYSLLAIDTAAPYELDYTSADGGKTAHYIFRWVSTTDAVGPWSDPVSATIPKV